MRGEFILEKRIGSRGQLEASLPVVAREAPSPSSQWKAGVGDVAVGVKYAFFHRLELGSIASLGGEVVFPTGRQSDGLGTGSVIFEPYLAAGQILPWDAFLQVQLLGEIPVDSDVSDEIQLRTALGKNLRFRRFGRALSPMLELLGTWEFRPSGGSNADWDLVPELQIPLSRRQHVRLDIGVRIPLTDASNRPTRLGLYLLWDWYDGGFTEGW